MLVPWDAWNLPIDSRTKLCKGLILPSFVLVFRSYRDMPLLFASSSSIKLPGPMLVSFKLPVFRILAFFQRALFASFSMILSALWFVVIWSFKFGSGLKFFAWLFLQLFWFWGTHLSFLFLVLFLFHSHMELVSLSMYFFNYSMNFFFFLNDVHALPTLIIS